MFGKLQAARENLRRSFAAQFDEYQGKLVYRKMMRGQPIAITDAEYEDFLADFEAFIPRFMWLLSGGIAALVILAVVLDGSGLLPMPDWIPILLPLIALSFGIIAHRRAMAAPAKALAMRAPMGAERSNKEFAAASLRALPYASFAPALVIGAAIMVMMGYALVANRSIFTQEPIWTSLASLFGAYMFFGSLISLWRKWQAEKQE